MYRWCKCGLTTDDRRDVMCGDDVQTYMERQTAFTWPLASLYGVSKAGLERFSAFNLPL